MQIQSPKELMVYQRAYALAMCIFDISRRFPPEERYSLTDQVRRSSRSVCANLREAWAQRRYPAHCLSKLSDCDGENAETDSRVDFAFDCNYITPSEHKELGSACAEVGRMLGSMIKEPQKFLPPTPTREEKGQPSSSTLRPSTADR